MNKHIYIYIIIYIYDIYMIYIYIYIRGYQTERPLLSVPINRVVVLITHISF